MAAKQTKNRSSSAQGAGSSKRTTNKSNARSSGTKRSSQTRGNKEAKLTKEEVMQQKEFHDEIMLVATLVIAILLMISNFDLGGIIGSAINHFIFGLCGIVAHVLPILLFIGVAFYLSNRGNRIAKKKIISGMVMMFTCMALFHMMFTKYNSAVKITQYYLNASVNRRSFKSGGGLIGGIICRVLRPLFGTAGTYVVLIAILIVCLMIFTGKAIITALSKRGKDSLQQMSERHREYTKSREYYEDQIEVEEEETPSVKQKRKARTVNLKKKKYEVDPETGEILSESEETNAGDVVRSKKKAKPMKEDVSHLPLVNLNQEFDMSEIKPDFEDLSISGSYVPSDSMVQPYEEELNEKFGKNNESGNEALQSSLGSQISSMLEEETNHENKDSSYDGSSSILEEDEAVKDQGVQKEDETQSLETMPKNETKTASSTGTKDAGGECSTVDIAKEIAKEQEEKPYVFPSLDLLSKPKKNAKGMTEKDLKETAMKLQKTLESFGVGVTITNVSCGPAVTRYEIQPEQGVKVSKITSLADDIKLNLAAADIRIEAPIPGKAAVGIEVPNKENAAVMLRELIETKTFTQHPSDIAFAVGKDIGGQTVVTDIAKMPHLLIAGATGSGKSVCINTLIMSILYKAHPNDVKLIMVDPKVVELSVYNGIPHLMIPVVTDPKKASAALNWAVMEMNERYKKFADLGVRDLKSYNAKMKEVEHLQDQNYQKLPQIVIIVDELADLMMVAPGEVEDAICRLAQMARAAGLHLVIATQRPSVNVITGLIKANVPSRVAFSVSSAIDSRTIIDGSGAEKLLGKGDMLFFPQGYPKPVRIQGAFISDKEVGAVVEFLSSENGTSNYNPEIANQITSVQNAKISEKNGSDRDEYFVQAGKFIIEKDKASIGMLQRVYKIGFNRAARIMDQLAEAGVVGPEEGTKPRKVIMSEEEFNQFVEECV